MIILNNLFILSSLIIFIIGFIRFVSYRKHLLNTLLRLEFMILGIFIFINLFISILGNELYFILFFLTLAACEGALGLSLLVSIVCFCGNDYYNRFRRIRC